MGLDFREGTFCHQMNPRDHGLSVNADGIKICRHNCYQTRDFGLSGSPVVCITSKTGPPKKNEIAKNSILVLRVCES